MSPGIIKTLNLLSAGSSYLLSSGLRIAVISGMPPALSIELTNRCNLQCPECPSGSGKLTRQRGFMEIEFFKHLMKELKPYLYYTNLYFQGEPMLHPGFLAFLNESRNIFTTVSTNGHFLSEENADNIVKSGLGRLIISLDGFTRDTYSSYRINGDVGTVMEGIRNVSEAKRRNHSSMKFEIQVLLNKANESEIPEIRRLALKAGATLVLKSMQLTDNDTMNSWLPADENFRRYRLKNGSYLIKSKLPRRCARLWFNPVITWDGKVIPCCFDKDAQYIMGDLKKDSIRNIWHGQKFKNFRSDVLSGREKIGMCRNCTSGLGGGVRT